METLTILILVRSVVDGTLPLPLQPVTRVPDLTNAARVINPFDEVAVEAAVQLRQGWISAGGSAEGCQLVVAGFADVAGTQSLERALALGADRAVQLAAPDPVLPGPAATRHLARELAALVRAEAPDLLLLGRMAHGQEQGELAGFLAGELAWPLAMAVSELVWNARLPGLDLLQRRADWLHRANLSLPAVVSCELDLATPRYVTLPALVGARRKPKQARSLGAPAGAPWPVLSWQGPESRSEGGPRLLAGVDELMALLLGGGERA